MSFLRGASSVRNEGREGEMIVGKERFESVKMIDRLDHDHPVGGVFEET